MHYIPNVALFCFNGAYLTLQGQYNVVFYEEAQVTIFSQLEHHLAGFEVISLSKQVSKTVRSHQLSLHQAGYRTKKTVWKFNSG